MVIKQPVLRLDREEPIQHYETRNTRQLTMRAEGTNKQQIQ